jgi:hypothetical protein
MDTSATPDDRGASGLSEPRPVHKLLIGAVDLYRRYPLLFFVLAAGVIVPYDLIVLAATSTGSFSRGSVEVGVSFLLTLADWALISPLISALHVRAVDEFRKGQDPRIRPVAIQGFRVLPVVAAVTIVSSLGITLGFLALFVPGIFLSLRWVVVAQVAALEHEGWLPALRRGAVLSADHYGHIFAFFVCVGVIVLVPTLLGGVVFGAHDTSAVSFLVGLAVHVFTVSFGALATALLFYDLLARRQLALWRTGPSRPSDENEIVGRSTS